MRSSARLSSVLGLLLVCAVSAADNPRLDVFGDPLPDGASARFGSSRMLHGLNVKALRFSADGKSLMSFDGREVRLWDLSTGRVLHRLSVRGLGFPNLRDDESVIYLDGQTQCLCVRHLRTGKTHIGPKVKGWIFHLVASPDGRFVVVAKGDEAGAVFSCADGQPPVRLPLAVGADVAALASSAAGGLLLSYRPGEVWMWDLRGGKQLAQAKPFSTWEARPGIAFSPNGQHLAVSDHSVVRLYDARTLRQLKKFNAQVPCAGLGFTSDGKELVAVDATGGVRRWFLQSKQLHIEKALVNLRENSWPSRRMAGGTDGCSTLSSDGSRVAFVGDNGRIRIMDLPSGRERVWEGREPSWDQVMCIGRGNVVTVSETNEVVFWDSQSGRAIRRLRLQNPLVSLSPGGKYAVCQDGRILEVIELAAGKRTFRASSTHNGVAAFSPDERFLVTQVEEKLLRLWNTARGTALRDIEMTESWAADRVVFSPDGRTLLGAAAGWEDVSVVEVATGRLRASFAFPGAWLKSDLLLSLPSDFVDVKYARDGNAFVLSRQWDLNVVSLRQNGGMHRFPHHIHDAHALSPDGRWLVLPEVVGGSVLGVPRVWSRRLMLYDLQSLTPLRPRLAFGAHEGVVASLDFTEDGKHLVSASEDGTALVWDMARLLAEPKPVLPPTEKQLARWWALLGDPDPQTAAEAMEGFQQDLSRTYGFFKERLRPVKEPPPGRIAALIADLDANRFVTRQQAVRELENLADLAESQLEAALTGKPTLEVSARIEQLLRRLHEALTEPDRLRELRAVEVLERMGTPEARKLLEALASGAAEARLTRETKASVARLMRVKRE